MSINSNKNHPIVLERRLGELTADHPASSSIHESPLTVFAKHTVHPGMEPAFQAWVRDMTDLQRNHFAGFRGAEVVKPTCCGCHEYVSIFRYDNYNHLQEWMNSPERKNMLDKAQVFSAAPVLLTYHSLEYWFVGNDVQLETSTTLSDTSTGGGEPTTAVVVIAPPKKWKMALVTFFVIYIQSSLLTPLVAMIPKLPKLVRGAITIAIIVALTTYLIMPLVTKYLLNAWLFRPVVPNQQKTTSTVKKTTTTTTKDDSTTL